MHLVPAAFYGAVKTLSLGFHELRVGSITYQVKTGDITKEDTDVIVNATNQTFNLTSGNYPVTMHWTNGSTSPTNWE